MNKQFDPIEFILETLLNEQPVDPTQQEQDPNQQQQNPNQPQEGSPEDQTQNFEQQDLNAQIFSDFIGSTIGEISFERSGPNTAEIKIPLQGYSLPLVFQVAGQRIQVVTPDGTVVPLT